jgi:hypothetical protein
MKDEYSNLKAESDNIISDYMLKLDKAENDLKSVDTYLREKNTYDDTIRNLENSIKEQRQQMFDALEDQERKMLEEKANLLRELDDQKLAFRDAAFKEVCIIIIIIIDIVILINTIRLERLWVMKQRKY